MDDLDHSVLIAERDWDSFYEESEECSIQQARLAGLDDSGLSDTDDEYNSTKESVLPHQSDTGKPIEENGAASPQAVSAVHKDCEVGKPSEASECFCYKADLEATAPISLNHSTATCTDLTLDSGVINIPPDGLTDSASDTNNFKEHNQSQSEDKFSQVTEEPITINSSLCTQNTEHAGSAEGETVTKVMESSPTPKKEKERWFVTVNDSPVQQSVYSGTSGKKKRRKKKTSRKLSQLSRATGEQQCPHSSNEKEADSEKYKKEEQKVQDDFKEPIHSSSEHLHFNTFPDNVNEDAASDLTTTQLVDLAPAKEPISKNKDENVSLSSKSNGTKIDVLTENPENNPSANPSPNSQPSSILINTSQLQANVQQVLCHTTQFADDQNTFMGLANNSTSNTDITTQNQQPISNNSIDVNNDPQKNGSQLIFRVSSTISSSDEQHEPQEYSAQCHEEENMSSSLQDAQKEGHQEPPNQSLTAAVGPSRPIYALSSFWDEMEKLTINDILHLRVANRSPPSGSLDHDNPVCLKDTDLLDSKDTDLQDSTLVDDSADSDYFTHVDDSKPDRSSCEFSTLSDFDEEFLQIINTNASTSPEPQSLNQSESFFESTYVSELLTEQDLGLTTVNNESQSEDIIMLCPQDGLPLYLYPTTDAQNIYLTHKPESSENPFELEGMRKTPSLVLSVGDILDDQCLMHFSDIFDQEDGEVSPARCSPILSFYSSKSLSVPETYDDFFSDFVVGNLFFPSVQDQTVPIPIFSSSRSVVRDMVFPEAEELIESDFEDNNCPIRVMTRFSNQQESSTDPSGTPNLFLFTSQRRNWKSLLSLRRISFIGKGSTWCQKVNSWIFPREAKQVTLFGSRAQPVSHLYLDNHCAKQQKYIQHTALISKREGLIFSIKQADMCLVCIAFASWVLKSSNPQSTDMWKAALLANVSALSAIQYLRKYEKKDGTEDDP